MSVYRTYIYCTRGAKRYGGRAGGEGIGERVVGSWEFLGLFYRLGGIIDLLLGGRGCALGWKCDWKMKMMMREVFAAGCTG